MTNPQKRLTLHNPQPLQDIPLKPLPLPSQSPFDGQQIVVSYGYEYYSYLVRFLDRLLYPDAWQGTDEQKAEATHWAQHLIDALGTPVMAESVQFRITEDCLLQYSYDGSSWATVDGWSDYAFLCFEGPQGPIGPVGPPGVPGNTGEGPGPGTDVPVIDQGECELDTLFGFCLQLVDLMDVLINQVFEALESATNDVERLQAWVDEVPFLGTALDLANAIQDEFREGYEASYTPQLRLEYACGLFCVARSHGCVLTWDDVATFFADTISSNPLLNAAEFVLFIVSGSWSGSAFADVMFSLITFVVYKGASWAGLDLETIQRLLASYWNDPNEDWVTLCDECPTVWHAVFDLTASQCGLTVEIGHYTAGIGLVADPWYGDPDTRRALATLDIATPADIHIARAHVADYIAGSWDASTSLWALAMLSEYSEPLATRAQLTGNADFEKTYDDTYASLGNLIDVRSARGATNGQAVVSQFELFGTGTAPQAVIDNATTFEYF